MRRGGRTAVLGALIALLTAPVLGGAPAAAACGNIRTTAATFPALRTVGSVTAAEPAPSPTPCPTAGPLGPTSDDDDSGTTKAAGLAVAAVVLIVGGVVLRRRANRG